MNDSFPEQIVYDFEEVSEKNKWTIMDLSNNLMDLTINSGPCRCQNLQEQLKLQEKSHRTSTTVGYAQTKNSQLFR